MKLFVWDFHGVLEKDNEKSVIEISNNVLSGTMHQKRFTEVDNEKYYGFKWYQYFEKLLPDLPLKTHLELQAACFEYAEKNLQILAKNIKQNDYADEVLGMIKRSGHQQIVISNSRQKDLMWFLDAVDLTQYFDDEHIIGVNAHQEHVTKKDALTHFLSGKHFDEIIVIGDAEEDMKFGKAVKAKTYFYKHPHRKHEITDLADYLINDLREVSEELHNHKQYD
jgi:phosphoglycolate phosphatase-like HAD superfamily hydrolase